MPFKVGKFIKRQVSYKYDEAGTRVPYMTRWFLIETKSWILCFHIFTGSDLEYLHDHPMPFVTLLLWRGYIEETLTPSGQVQQRRYWPGAVLFRRADHAHRIVLVNDKPAATLVWLGPKHRKWGFFLPNADGALEWVPWRKFRTDQRRH